MRTRLEVRAVRTPWAPVLVRLYAVARLRGAVLWVLRRLEGGEFTSPTLREIFARYWGVEVGMYTHGACFQPWAVDRGTTIGRYCSFAPGIRILNHNHPLGFKGTSGLFFNPALGLCERWLVPRGRLSIGNDVWVGANAVVMPEVRRIGDGAVIGAGAVVGRDVPPYAVVLGNPGRVVRYRFPPDVVVRLLEERWWDRDLPELLPRLAEFQRPVDVGATSTTDGASVTGEESPAAVRGAVQPG